MERQRRARTFGGVADRYDRYRRGYAPELYAALTAYLRRPGRRLLEIGAGTGKATVGLVAAGFEVTAVEPDAQMAALLVQRVPGVPVLPASFEDAPLSDRYDVLAAAAAFHWTDPRTRWDRAADLLDDDGVVALFASGIEPVGADARAVFEDLVNERPAPTGATEWTDPPAEHPAFGQVEAHQVDRIEDLARADMIGHLSTFSAFLILDDAAQARVVARFEAAAPDPMPVRWHSEVTLARRVRR